MIRNITLTLLIARTNYSYRQLVTLKINITKTQIDSAKSIVSRFLVDEKIPGMAISVSTNDSLIWSEGFGFANLKDSILVHPDKTQFRIASISKTLSALALGILKDTGKLDFDKSIYTYLPDYPKHQYDFTIRQLAGHTAGIRHYKGTESYLEQKNVHYQRPEHL